MYGPETNLKETFFASYKVCNEGGLDAILKPFTNTKCDKMDAKLVSALRNFLFGKPGQGGHDLAALNIQRGRDHGLPDYNTFREAAGLEKFTSFSQLTDNPELAETLEQLYGNIDNVDVFVGGLVEETKTESLMGQLFTTVLTEQFQKIRDGDRFWYQRRLPRGARKYIEHVKLSDILRRNTGLRYVPDNVFKVPHKKHHGCH